MPSIVTLGIVLGVLMVIVGGKQGISAFCSIILNFGILFLTVILIASGFPPLAVSLFAGICILAITIYMGNHDEHSTNTAFVATLIVLAVMLLLIIPLDHFAQIKGFSMEQSEEIEAFNLLIGVSFEQLAISTAILSTLGAISEAAIAVASGLEEIIEQNPGITKKELYKSGGNIGSQIMGMTFNTLFFGMFGSDLALFILLAKLHESFGYYLNSKIFVSECMLVLYSAIAVIGVIVITTYLTARKLKK
ncbi:YibE/F family protein [Ligilactobacillus sp. LYQ135]